MCNYTEWIKREGRGETIIYSVNYCCTQDPPSRRREINAHLKSYTKMYLEEEVRRSIFLFLWGRMSHE